MHTCGTCRFWNFKVSTDKAWGQCLNQKVIESTYVSAHIPDNLAVKEIHLFMRNVSTFTTIYFEEDTFGCIHHERLSDD